MMQGRTPEQPVPTNYDIVSFARSVMVSDVQKLFVSASFPPELRLQAMKAGVPRNTVCKLSSFHSMKSVDGLRNEAHGLLLFPPRERWYQLDVWADEETSNMIRSTAEQAFLETVMFKLGINDSLPTSDDDDWMSSLSSIPEIIGTRIHYLNLNTTIQCHWDAYEQHLHLDVAYCRRTIECMDVLKLRFPNLKACVLTLDLSFSSIFGPVLHPFDRLSLERTTGMDADFECFQTSLPAEASSLFDTFVANGPGKSQFVRIRQFPEPSYDEHTDGPIHYGPLVKVDCEKMAAKPDNGSFGTQLFRDAYRLARSGQQPTVEARMLKK